MALSGSIDFTINRDQCIQYALEVLGVLGEGETPTENQLTSDAVTLNLMLKSWQNTYLAQNLFKKFFLFLDNETREYTLSTTAASSAHSAYNFYYDKTAADYADGATTLTADSGTGAATNDTVLLVSDSETLLSGNIDAGGVEALTVEDLNGNAESGNPYFAYTTKVTRPVDIVYANRCLESTDYNKEDTVMNYTKHPIRILNRRDFVSLNAPDTDGAVTAIWYEEDWPDAVLHVWPEPKAGEFLELWGQFQIDDMDAETDNFYLPSNWYLAVVFNLAYWLTSKYGVSDKTRTDIKEKAGKSLQDAMDHEAEDYVRFMPSNRKGYGY